MNKSVTIFFLRHGRSAADDEGVHEGRYDSVLTEVGLTQVQTRASKWKDQALSFTSIIASPLRRAASTAQIVAQALNSTVETDPDWMEMDNRPLAGLAFDVAESRFPRPHFRNPYESFYGVGESDWELQCRAIRATEKVVRRGPGCYLVVAHGGILNAALRGIVGAQPPLNGQHGVWFAFGDTGYIKSVYEPASHRWLIEELVSEWQPE